MIRFLPRIAALSLLGLLALGCSSISTAPQPMNPNELQAAVDKAKPQEQIDWINRSPASAEEKAKKIQAVQKKYGLPETGAVTPGGH